MAKKKDEISWLENILLNSAGNLLESNLLSEDNKKRLIEFGMRISGGNTDINAISEALNFAMSGDGKKAVMQVLTSDEPVADIISQYGVENYGGLAFSNDFVDFDKEYFMENHPNDTDFISTYVTGKTPFTSAGVIRVDDNDSTRVGRYGNYIEENYKGRDIPVFQAYRDTLNADLVKALNLASFNKETNTYGAHTDETSPFPFGKHTSEETSGYYDAAGYNIELITGKDGKVYGRKSDMYDFLPRDFVGTWVEEGGSGIESIINAVDERGNPFIFRTPWFEATSDNVPEEVLEQYSENANKKAEGGENETTDIAPAIITQDDEFNKFLMSLPENQRQTPESEYYTYKMWKIAGKPKDFNQAKDMGLYHWNDSDRSYHGNSVIYDEASDVYHFLKPKHHSTVGMELDWYNYGVHTDDDGNKIKLEGVEKEEWEDFRKKYYLDSSGDDYAYRRRPHIEHRENVNLDSLKSGIQESIKAKLDSIVDGANIYDEGGEKESTPSKKDVEDVVRTTRGATGSVFGRNFPWIDLNQLGYLYDSWKVMKGDKDYVAPMDNNYTGAAMVGRGVMTDDGLGFVSQQDLIDVLGHLPRDFIDTYVYGDIPFEELGVVRKDVSPERHVIRTKVGKVEKGGNRMNTYQTQRDTLDAAMVHQLDSLLNAGQVDLHSSNSTHQGSPFEIGDSGIIYDGNNSVKATVYLPNGQPVSKAIDVFDTDPTEWNYTVGPMAKNGLKFIHNNTNPFIMTTPWFYPEYSKDYVGRLENLFGIRVDPNDLYIYENKGDKNGVKWDLHEALEWIDTHPDLTEMPVKPEKSEEEDNYWEYAEGGQVDNSKTTTKVPIDKYTYGLDLDLNVPNSGKVVVPYKSVVTPEMETELITESDDKFKTFVEKMYPIIEQTLLRKKHSLHNIDNILRQMALESNYGLNSRGNGYNLSGIKAWNDEDGTKHTDGQYYRNFKDYSDYADFYIDLLNNRYDALNAKDADDYIRRLHNGVNGLKYSANEGAYRSNFKNMKSLDQAIQNYLKK